MTKTAKQSIHNENMPYDLRKEFDSKWRRNDSNLMCDLIYEWIEKNFIAKSQIQKVLEEIVPNLIPENTDIKNQFEACRIVGFNQAIQQIKNNIKERGF